jgi:exopolyphosphatase / guanosine-5'-triphosphate,3'-diphosphate pyrophosphatase
VAGLSPTSLHAIRAVARSRAETLPYGAMVLERILARAKARNVVVSVFGVREGLIYASLKKNKRDADPLLSACWDFARRYARSPAHELELCDWTDQIFGTATVQETGPNAGCAMPRACSPTYPGGPAPDYRGSRAVTVISQASFVGVDHPGRAFLALAVFFRYEGPGSDSAPAELVRLVDEAALERARQLAAAMRLAYVLTAAMTGVLPQIGLEDMCATRRCGSRCRKALPTCRASRWTSAWLSSPSCSGARRTDAGMSGR